MYIIVFEMVMHEPVNQLAADKRAGPWPETHTHTILPPRLPDVISSNTFSSLMIPLSFLPHYFLLPLLSASPVVSVIDFGNLNLNVAEIANQMNTTG